MIKYRSPLKRGDKIGLTVPSSGIPPNLHPRFDVVVKGLEQQFDETSKIVNGN
jgi:hypothetical protein